MTVGERDPGAEDKAGKWPLGSVLQNQRTKMGLSLHEVARRSNLSRATVTYYETGFRADNQQPVNPTVKILRPLAEVLELELDHVLNVAGITPAQRESDEEAAARVAARSAHLADRIALLDPEFRRAVETIVDSYLRAQGLLPEQPPVVKSGPAEPVKRGVRSSARGTKGLGAKVSN